MVTFTAESARRLRHEVGRQLDTRAADLAIHTLHAFGRKVVDTWPGKFGFPTSPTVVHRDEAHDLLTRAAAQLGWDLSSVTPNELASAVDRYRLSDDAAVGVAADPDDALNTDARHRVTLSAVYLAPFGINVSGVGRFRTGLPYSRVSGSDLNGDIFSAC